MPYQLNISLPDDLADKLKAYAAGYGGVGVSIADAARILLSTGIDTENGR